MPCLVIRSQNRNVMETVRLNLKDEAQYTELRKCSLQ